MANRLIATLPRKDRSRLLANCEEVDLVLGEILVEPGDLIRHVHFPTGGSFISMITPVNGASALEVGLVGHEGMHGVSLALGVDAALVHARVQGGGRALRMSAAAFKRELRHSPALRRRMNHYLYVLMGQLAQSSLCTRYHVVEARLARWLLMTRDRAHSDQFQITQRFLGWMLGVRRSGITRAANNLQKRALITYKRGHIAVLNHRGLEAAACTCYLADRSIYQRILGEIPRHDDATSIAAWSSPSGESVR